MKINVGERIKKYRKKKGLTQKDLGKLIGCDGRTISLYERGKFNPAAHIIVALADALDISTEKLLRDDNYLLYHPLSFFEDKELFNLFAKLDEFSFQDKTTVKELLKLLISNQSAKK